MDAERFGAFLQQRRKTLGLTQADLAERIHVTDKAISRWERGVGFPDIKLLEPLAHALELSLSELLQCRLSEQPLCEDQPWELEKEAAEILETEKKLSWQRKLILWLGYGMILSAAFVLVYISHQSVLSVGLRFAVYAIGLLGTFFTSQALRFIVERLYLRSKPWGVWENPRTWAAWGLKISGLLLAAYARRRAYSDANMMLMLAGVVLFGAGWLLQSGQKEK